MLPTSDTAAIDLFLTDRLKKSDLRQFQLRLLRDASFLEKVFLKKLSLANPNITNTGSDIFSVEEYREIISKKIRPRSGDNSGKEKK